MAMEAIVERRSLSRALPYQPRAASLFSEIKLVAANFQSTQIQASVAAAWRIVLEWRRRRHSRQQLRLLSPRLLQDFCLDPMEAEREARKPFWRA
jgi:uncharacterized protein YjiS (DUF1127 family)